MKKWNDLTTNQKINRFGIFFGIGFVVYIPLVWKFLSPIAFDILQAINIYKVFPQNPGIFGGLLMMLVLFCMVALLVAIPYGILAGILMYFFIFKEKNKNSSH